LSANNRGQNMVRSINPIVGMVSKEFRHKQAPAALLRKAKQRGLHKGGSFTEYGFPLFLYLYIQRLYFWRVS